MSPSNGVTLPSATTQSWSATIFTRWVSWLTSTTAPSKSLTASTREARGIHVEMVGRLVEQQQVRGVARRQRQQQPRLLAARQHADLEVGAVAREAEAAELGAHLGLAGGRPEGAAHVLERRRLVVEAFLLVLREVADAQARRALDLALARLQAIRQQPDEGRLAVAVLAQERDAVVHVEPEVELAQHQRAVAVADR